MNQGNMISPHISTSVGRAVLAACVLWLFLNIGVSRSYSLDENSVDDLGLQEMDLGGVQAQLTSLQSQLGAVLQRVISVQHRFSALDHSITALDHRVSSLEQRLNSLQLLSSAKWEGGQMDEGHHGHYPGVDSGEEGDRGRGEAVQQGESVPFKLEQVTRKDLGYVHMVSMLYQASADPQVLLKMDSYPVRVQSSKPGEATVYIPKQENTTSPCVYFVFLHYFTSICLNLTSLPSIDLPATTLKIAPGNDVTFRPGQDTEIDFTFSVEGDTKMVESERATIQSLMKSEKNENIVDRSHFHEFNSAYTTSASSLRLDLKRVEGSKNYRRGAVVINTSHANTDVIFEAFVTLNFNCSVNCLVKRMTTQHHVSVYRADHHGGPFPEGFLGFVRDDYERNESHVLCEPSPYARPCGILCEAVGDDVLSVHIEKVGAPREADSDHARRLTAGGGGGYWATALLALDKPRVQDSGNYLCVARSERRKITRSIALVIEGRGED
ncbi:hypothetical protein ACOMHN_040189 [Nucella lapillus]